MSDVDSSPTVGPWAREKLDALGAYLDFYMKVLKNQSHWCKGTIYVDAFAGQGRARVRRKDLSPAGALLAALELPVDQDDEEFIRGSPRVALDIPNPFSQYVFIERDPARAAQLEELRTEYPARRIDVHQGTAEQEIDALLQGDLGRPGFRAVVFLDPFGMQIPWATVERLAATKGIEVMINFTLGMAIQRLLVRSGEINQAWRAALDRFFGTSEWWDQAYEESADLFGPQTRKLRDSGQRLLEWYRGRLEAAFGHVSPARLIRNTRGGHLYYLIWAGPHPKGLVGANHILSKGEKVTRSTL
ncbi:MAG TPA: three-Cys-motif partner protein TcmP [Geminicoccus sp.]|uniref:three-Cys-motif partner protein TcmP n=1 Tax=Geminicoccus sp. TaxID=2024832 RepID=UPI002CDED75A|nr:three-Cys-motif partner protein TcmP [Geminicoccus sp.]HWL69382.1 three-Cys-motif partner protein TcmP [Geminicoccus sp.]